MDIHFWPKNENESHLIILVFFFFFMHSVTKSALQCAANTSSIFAFLHVVLVDGILLSLCTVGPIQISLWHFSSCHFNP